MIKAIIFDFDGVLVMSEHARFEVLQSMARNHGLEIKDELFKIIVGRTTRDFFRIYFPTLEHGILEKILADYTTEYSDKIIDHTTPIAFTNDFIRNYTGDKVLAVTSGSTTHIIELLLTHLELREKISVVVGQEHVAKHKPDPEAYIFTAGQLKLSTNQCMVFEDTAVGAEAAHRAGMQVYAILNGLNLREDFQSIGINGFVENYDELLAATAS